MSRSTVSTFVASTRKLIEPVNDLARNIDRIAREASPSSYGGCWRPTPYQQGVEAGRAQGWAEGYSVGLEDMAARSVTILRNLKLLTNHPLYQGRESDVLDVLLGHRSAEDLFIEATMSNVEPPSATRQ